MKKADECFDEEHLAEGGQTTGFVLIAAAIVALIIANTPVGPFWQDALHFKLGIGQAKLSVEHWINDALMAVFFLLIGIEVKRDFLEGDLSDPKAARLPVLGAFGGVLIPALLYGIVSKYLPAGDPKGWPIPTATDIAFSLAVLNLVGKKMPSTGKTVLTAIAVVDDLMAIIIIALFFANDFQPLFLFIGVGILAAMFVLNRRNYRKPWMYIVLGIALWICLYLSGIHATLAGVALGLALPFKIADKFEHQLNKPVHFIILPLFALANCAINLSSFSIDTLFSGISMGVMVGLVLGKPLGILAGIYLGKISRLIVLPKGLTITHLIGLGLLCGIGFTMSLLMAVLSFPGHPEQADVAKIAVLVGSIFSGALGFALLKAQKDTVEIKSNLAEKAV